MEAYYHNPVVTAWYFIYDKTKQGVNGMPDIKIDTSTITIETKRLILRPFVESDLEDMYVYASVPGVGEMAGWPHHTSIETTKMILQSFVDGNEVLAIFHKPENKVIGSFGIHKSWANDDERFKHLKSKEIGYVLSKDFWGQGLVPEATKAVIDYGFNDLGIEAFTCCHFVENAQSRRVIEKTGFEFVMQSTYYSSQMDKTFDDMKYILIGNRS